MGARQQPLIPHLNTNLPKSTAMQALKSGDTAGLRMKDCGADAGGFKMAKGGREAYLAGRARVRQYPRQMVAKISMEMNTI